MLLNSPLPKGNCGEKDPDVVEGTKLAVPEEAMLNG
jgi:hypothetical protein